MAGDMEKFCISGRKFTKGDEQEETRFEREEPWLMVAHGKDYQMQTFYGMSRQRCELRSIPELQGRLPVSHSFGWLVLQDANNFHQLILLNLESMQKIQLPQVTRPYISCLLSAPPTDPNCRVVFFAAETVMVCQGNEVFEKDISHLLCDDDEVTAAILFNGHIFCTTSSGTHLFQVEFEGPSPNLTNVIETVPVAVSASKFDNTKLVECCGDLLLVGESTIPFGGSCGIEYRVFKFNSGGKTWVEVNDIGHNAIFLSDHNSYSASTVDCNAQSNSIHYFSVCCRNTYLHIFGLGDTSINHFLPCPNISRNHFNFTWLKLSAKKLYSFIY